jgi:hypothetical protein
MIINNFTELGNFAKANKLDNLCKNLIRCLNEYSLLCTCLPNEQQNKLTECQKYYMESISAFSSNKTQIFNKLLDSKIEFHDNGRLISTLVR